MIRRCWQTLIVLVMLPGVALAQKVTHDWDVAKDFSQYRAYVWPKGEITGNHLVDGRIKVDVDTQLEIKGWRLVTDVNQADAAIVVNVATQQQKSLDTFYTGMGPGWGWGGVGTATTNVNTYTNGTIVVDIFEAKSRRLIWRSTATDSVSDDPQKNAKKIQKAVEKMFKKFPPKPAKTSK